MWPLGRTKALPSALYKAAIGVGSTNPHPQAFWKEKEIRLTEPLQTSKHCRYLVQAQCCMTDPKPESAFLPRPAGRDEAPVTRIVPSSARQMLAVDSRGASSTRDNVCLGSPVPPEPRTWSRSRGLVHGAFHAQEAGAGAGKERAGQDQRTVLRVALRAGPWTSTSLENVPSGQRGASACCQLELLLGAFTPLALGW